MQRLRPGGLHAILQTLSCRIVRSGCVHARLPGRVPTSRPARLGSTSAFAYPLRKDKGPPEGSSHVAPSTASPIHHPVAEYVRHAELLVMRSMYFEDLWRFRLLTVGAILSVMCGIIIYWSRIKSRLQSSTSEFATAVLQAKDVQDQAGAAAKAVVDALLSDPAVHAQVLAFVTQVVSSSDTQAASADLVRKTLDDAGTKAQLRAATDALVQWLLADPGVRARLQALLWWLVQQPDTQAALVGLVKW